MYRVQLFDLNDEILFNDKSNLKKKQRKKLNQNNNRTQNIVIS